MVSASAKLSADTHWLNRYLLVTVTPPNDPAANPAQKYSRKEKESRDVLERKVVEVLQRLPQDIRPQLSGFTTKTLDLEDQTRRKPKVREISDGATELLEHVLQLYFDAVRSLKAFGDIYASTSVS